MEKDIEGRGSRGATREGGGVGGYKEESGSCGGEEREEEERGEEVKQNPALRLLTVIIVFELTICAAAIAGCFAIGFRQGTDAWKGDRCNGELITGLLNTIVAQGFGLYAAEK